VKLRLAGARRQTSLAPQRFQAPRIVCAKNVPSFAVQLLSPLRAPPQQPSCSYGMPGRTACPLVPNAGPARMAIAPASPARAGLRHLCSIGINDDRTRNGGSRPSDTHGPNPNTGLYENRNIPTRVHPSTHLLPAHTRVASHNPNSRTATLRDRLGRRPRREVRQAEAAGLRPPVAGAWSQGLRHELA
jgi:hypothetical protein